MGSLALPCGSLTPLMPTNLVSVRHFFFTAIAAIRLPRHHFNDRLPAHYNSGADWWTSPRFSPRGRWETPQNESRCKYTIIHIFLSILLYHFNIYLTYQCQYVAHLISYITTMNIKQLQHNLNYKLYSTGTPSIQTTNFTLFIEAKIMKQTL